jgi:SOS-response transcriptional repressor LexA
MAFSWNSELASGHNPFRIRDDALAGLGLHPGDTVAVDTNAQPVDGDLVVAEAEIEGDSLRLARRYSLSGDCIRLESADGAALVLPADSVIVLGVISARVRFDGAAATEEPL